MTESKRKKNKATNKGCGLFLEDVSNDVALHDQVFEDNRLPNRLAEILFELLKEKEISVRAIMSACIDKIMEGVASEEDEVNEEIPAGVDEEPTMGQISRCGFNSGMVKQPFHPVVKSEDFASWIYQIIKTIPYCYPLRNRRIDNVMSGSSENRINVLATIVLGLLWNNDVFFGKDFPVKQKNSAPENIPIFKTDVIDSVKSVIKGRSRICRSNVGRSHASKNKRRRRMKSPEDEEKKEVTPKSKKRVRSPAKTKETTILDIEENDDEVCRKPKKVYAAKHIESSSVVTEPVVSTNKRSTRGGRNI